MPEHDDKSVALNTHDFDAHTGFLHVIPTEYSELFLHFFSLEVMIDEVVYTYFQNFYSNFRGYTLYPKIDFCGHGRITRKNPWCVLQYRPRLNTSHDRIPLMAQEKPLILVRYLNVTRDVFDIINSKELRFVDVLKHVQSDHDVMNPRGPMKRALEDILPQYVTSSGNPI